MNTKGYTLEFFIDYVEGLLDAQTVEELEAWLMEHEEERVMVDGIQHFYSHNNKNRQALEEYLKVDEKQIPKRGNTGATNGWGDKFRRLHWTRLAAIFVLGIGAWWMVHNQNEATLDDFCQEYYAVPMVVRGGTSDPAELSEWYAAHDYEQVLNWAQIHETSSLGAAYEMMVALSYFYSEDYETADKLLETLAQGTSRFQGPSVWFLALSNLQLGQVESAKEELQQLIEKGDYKTEEAQELLDALPSE